LSKDERCPSGGDGRAGTGGQRGRGGFGGKFGGEDGQQCADRQRPDAARGQELAELVKGAVGAMAGGVFRKSEVGGDLKDRLTLEKTANDKFAIQGREPQQRGIEQRGRLQGRVRRFEWALFGGTVFVIGPANGGTAEFLDGVACYFQEPAGHMGLLGDPVGAQPGREHDKDGLGNVRGGVAIARLAKGCGVDQVQITRGEGIEIRILQRVCGRNIWIVSGFAHDGASDSQYYYGRRAPNRPRNPWRSAGMGEVRGRFWGGACKSAGDGENADVFTSTGGGGMKSCWWMMAILCLMAAGLRQSPAKGPDEAVQVRAVATFRAEMNRAATAADARRVRSKQDAIRLVAGAGAHLREVEEQLLAELAGADGEVLAAGIGETLVHLGAEEGTKIARMAEGGKIAQGRATAALAAFKKVEQARADFRTAASAEARYAALRVLSDMRVATMEEVRKAWGDSDPKMRAMGLLVAVNLDLSAEDWSQVLALIQDGDEHVRNQARITAVRDGQHQVPEFDEKTVLGLRDYEGCKAYVTRWVKAHGIRREETIDQLLEELKYEAGSTFLVPPGIEIASGLEVPAEVARVAGARIKSRMAPAGGWPSDSMLMPATTLRSLRQVSPFDLDARKGEDLELLGYVGVFSEKVLETLMAAGGPEAGPNTDEAEMQAYYERTFEAAFRGMLKVDGGRALGVIVNHLEKVNDSDRGYQRCAKLIGSLDSQTLNVPGAAGAFSAMLGSADPRLSFRAYQYFFDVLPGVDEGTARELLLLTRGNGANSEKLWERILQLGWDRPGEAPRRIWAVILKEGTSAERLRLLTEIRRWPDRPLFGPEWEAAFGDSDARVREGVVACMAARQAMRGGADLGAKLLGQALADKDKGVRIQAFRIAVQQGHGWLEDKSIREGAVEILAKDEALRTEAWAFLALASPLLDASLKGDREFQMALRMALWDGRVEVQKSSREIWGRTYGGRLPTRPMGAAGWVVMFFGGVICVGLGALVLAGAWRAMRLGDVPERVNPALTAAGNGGVVAGGLVILTGLVTGVVLIGVGGTSEELVTAAIGVACAWFALSGGALVVWGVGAKSGRLADGIVLMILAGLGTLVFAVSVAVDAGSYIIAASLQRFDGAAVFRGLVEAVILVCCAATVLALMRSWKQVSRARGTRELESLKG
jgi:hypothetical protein